jgi:flagellar protein FliS
MLPPKGLAAYRSIETQSRTPLELVVMLYDGALRFLGNGRDAIARNDIRARGEAFSRLLAIISELQNTLDVERGGPVASSLDGLYDFMKARVMDSAIANDAAPLDEVKRVLETLRDGWQQIAVQGAATTLPASLGPRR